ncbi:MAG: HYR domain-containing protein [Saprospiraceae bacterium]|nr:HYR domain-containing protein [Saprospiraceae bacterium]
MRSLILFILGALLPALLSAQTANTFFSTFDAERGSVLRPASDGNIWLGAMKDERVLISKLHPNGKSLELHQLNFTGLGLDNDYLADVFEDSDGMLVGCGNFENDNLGRGFLFRYNPNTRSVLWHVILRSGLTNVAGVLEMGPGGDYVLYCNPQFNGGSDVEIIQFGRSNGQPVGNKNRRYSLNTYENFAEMIFHDGALYACGRFTGIAPAPEARMRHALCKIDAATFEPLWTRLGPLPYVSSGWFFGRDLLIEDGAIYSTCSGDHFTYEQIRSEVYLQKNDLDGNWLWARLYQLPKFKSPFAEEIVSLPDGFLLFGQDLLSDTSRYFLLKTDKEGNAIRAAIIDYGYNDKFPEISSRSKLLRLGDAVYLTGLTQNAAGQTQGILAKTDLDGWISDTCGLLRPTEVVFFDYDLGVSEAVTPAQGPALASLESGIVQVGVPQLSFSKQCGLAETCLALPDLRLTLDSVTCTDGNALLHYSFCNVGGQTYEGSSFFGLYAKNPLTDSVDLISVVIHLVNNLAPGDCQHMSIASNPIPPMAFQLDTFTQLYGLLGINLNTPTPIDPATFPISPNSPECGYLNNLDSIAVPDQLCNTCEDPTTFVKKLGSPQRTELGFGMCHASDGTLYVLGRQDNKVMISKITPNGEPLWTRNFPGSSNAPIGMAEIIEDSEGKLVICGTQEASFFNRRILLMRYDPVSGDVLWYKHIGSANSHPEALGVMEKTPGGNYLVSRQRERVVSGVLRSWAEIQEIDRLSGLDAVPGGLRLSFPGNPGLRFESMVIHQGSIYAAGYAQSTLVKPLFAKIDLASTNVDWALQTTPDSTHLTGAAHRDLIVDNNLFVLAGDLQKSATDSAQGRVVYLEKHAADGALLWVRSYDIDMRPEDVLALPDAYIVFGKLSDNRYGMFKTDKNGNLLLAKTLFTAAAPATSTRFNSRQSQLLRSGNFLLMLDHDQSANGLSDILLLKTDLNFHLDDPCSLLNPAAVGQSVLPAKIGAMPLTKITLSTGLADAGVSLSPDPLAVRKLCPECPCTDKPDITYQVDSVYCSPTLGPVANVRICNLGALAPPSGFYLNFYDKNPLEGPATLLFSTLDQDKPAPGACIEYALPLDAAWLQFSKIYTLVGVKDDVPTPVSLDGFPYPDGFAECDYVNNLDSFDLHLLAPQKPDLGPDRSICPGQNTLLDAGSGYASYLWQNGPATQTFPVSASGAYVVAVTDDCGRTLRDTVQVTVLPLPAPTIVTLGFYPGDTIVLAGTAYTQPDTVVQTLVSAAGCDSVVTTILTLLSSQINLQCPANLTVSLPASQSTVAVNYDLPSATTTCPDPALAFKRLQGPASGGFFPLGLTTVCYEAANQCGLRDTCCFSVGVEASAAETACDVKNPPGCLRYELLGIRLDSIGQRRYRLRVTNTCASPLQYAVVQLPNGVQAVSPKEGALYAAPGGNTYAVRNPNASPFYSIRFKTASGSLNNGKSDIFEYVLPQQSTPDYIHIAGKLADGAYSEAHLNTFNCPVQPYSASRNAAPEQPLPAEVPLALRPNPSDGQLFVDLQRWEGMPVSVQVLSAQGQLVVDLRLPSAGTWLELQLAEQLSNGLYFLSVQQQSGERVTTRFVLAR